MATSQGYLASVGWNDSSSVSYVLNAYNWTLTYEAGEGETTDFSTTQPKTFIPLTTEWSGTASLRWDAGTALPDFETTLNNIKLFIDTATTFGFGGSCFCTIENPTLDVNGVAEGTVNFRGSAALTIGDISGISLS
jgi:hypothetical protein